MPIKVIAPEEPSSTPAHQPQSQAVTSKPRSESSTRFSARWRKALPHRIPAASQGTMNNLTFGGPTRATAGATFAYYETIAGGLGARPESRRISASTPT